MHSNTIFTETGIKNRNGSMYRDYADNKLSHFKMVEDILTDDIISICMAAPSGEGNSHNAEILMNIKRHFKEKGLLNDNNLVGLVSYQSLSSPSSLKLFLCKVV